MLGKLKVLKDSVKVRLTLNHLIKERGNDFIAGSKMTNIRPWYGLGIKYFLNVSIANILFKFMLCQ